MDTAFFINKRGEKVISCNYNYSLGFSEGLAAVETEEGKWGFLNQEGLEVISCRYDGAYPFIEGIAKVKLGEKWIYIDKNGNGIHKSCQNKIMTSTPSQQELFKVRKNGKWGFNDPEGNNIIPCKYDEVWGFSHGIVRVKLDGKEGYIDKNGKVIIPCIFDEVGFVSEEGLVVVELNKQYGFFDNSGIEIVPCKYDFAHDFCEGFAIVEQDFKYGIINTEGIEVVPCKYDYIEEFSEGMAKVLKNKLWGFIDASGQEVIPCQYEYAGNFSEELAFVSDEPILTHDINFNPLPMPNESQTFLVNKLKSYCGINLDLTYQNTKYDCPLLSNKQRNQLGQMTSSFQRQMKLKSMVSKRLKGHFDNWEVDSWIVHKWGGINNFNIDDHQRITTFKNNLQQGFTESLKSISSLSKIASFVEPEHYFVYDSRVAYALNGLLLDYLKTNAGNSVVFYPMPSALGGRDKRMKSLILQRCPNASFYSENEAYERYNNVILSLNRGINDGLPPCRVEMLLFELGKTNGVIEKLCGLSKTNNPPSTDGDGGTNCQILPIDPGTSVEGRVIDKGYEIQDNGKTIFYLIVGRKKTFIFCELLLKGKRSISCVPFAEKLRQEGYHHEGNGYLYKSFAFDDEESAFVELDRLKEIVSDKSLG